MVMNIDQALIAVGNEVLRAKEKHKGDFHNFHEAYGVLKEEVDEFWDEVKAQKHDKEAIKKELIQIAAMAIRGITELCD